MFVVARTFVSLSVSLSVYRSIDRSVDCSGKSTTLGILSGDISPTAGQASIAGHNILTEQVSRFAKFPDRVPYFLDRAGNFASTYSLLVGTRLALMVLQYCICYL